MRTRQLPRLALLVGLACLPAVPAISAQPPTFKTPDTHQPTDAELDTIRAKTEELGGLLEQIRSREPLDPGHPGDEFADVAVFHKAAEWIVRHGEFYRPDFVGMTIKALDTGLERARQLLDRKHPWRAETGSHVLGYVSAVDGSVQPYAVIVPELPENRSERMRLDVILHGRNATLNEVRFIADHEGKPADDEARGLVLHVLGRGNNAYRWAGETDVFEAIAAVKRAFPVDERRILLRGFSMGGAGAWHLGLHHPAEWCAVEAGAGFTDTKNYTRRDDFPDYQEKGLHIYDAVDYALNATMVPMAGYGGELDKQLAASTNILEALKDLGFPMKTEGLVTRSEGDGLDFLHVIGKDMGHKIDPASATILEAFRDEHAEAGRPRDARALRFVTYTLKYNQAPWLSVERLNEHYRRSTISATIDPATQEVRVEADPNIAVLGIDRSAGETVRLDDQVFPLRTAVDGLLPKVYFRQGEQGWNLLEYDLSRGLQENDLGEKAPGLQGPIDDAFTGPFLCVRGTGHAWNGRLQEWADARLERFATEWDKYQRGRLQIKNDVDVTPEDIQRYHLVLFGDPGSNALIAALLDRLPLRWSRQEFQLAGQNYGSADHAPALIAINPEATHHYVVLNSGYTFGASEFEGTNALLYPHLGDYAAFRLDHSTRGGCGFRVLQ